MQYDLFHAYTVDAHTLFVVSNLRPGDPALRPRASELSRIMQSLPRPRSPTSRRCSTTSPRAAAATTANSARRCRGVLPRAGPVALRRAPGGLAGQEPPAAVGHRAEEGHHRPAGHQRTSRPRVGDETHLDYLYLLTVADVRGTNPKLWNSWRPSLFHEFYERVKRALRRGLERPDRPGRAGRETQQAALESLGRGVPTRQSVDGVPGRSSPTPTSCGTPAGDRLAHPAARRRRRRDRRPGGVAAAGKRPRHAAIMTYARTAITASRAPPRCWTSSGLNIVDARITPTQDGNSPTPTTCSRTTARRSPTAERRREIEQRLCCARCRARRRRRSASRARAAAGADVQHATQIHVQHRRAQQPLRAGADRRRPPRTCCATSARCCSTSGSTLAAKIMTVGERAEDVFYVTDRDNRPLDAATAERLVARLTEGARPPARGLITAPR